jgi:hypothetical protein
MKFIVGPDGDMCQKDICAGTNNVATEMTTFDRDLTWSRVAVTNE